MSYLYVSRKQAAVVLADLVAPSGCNPERAKFNEKFNAVRGAIASWADGAHPSPSVVERVMSDIRDLRAADLRHATLCHQLSDLVSGNYSGRVVVDEELALDLFPPVDDPVH